MNFKIKFTTYALILTPILEVNLQAPIKDFGRSAELAKKWAEKAYHEWFWDKLSSKETSALNEYTRFGYKKINRYLNETNGQLVKETDALSQKYRIKDLNEQIETIDNALEKIQIPDSINVYKRVDERYFSLEIDELRNENGQMKQKLVKKIHDIYITKEIKQYNFISTSLINEPEHITFNYIEFPILMKIKVPKGIHGGYLGQISNYQDELEMLLKRNYTFRYDRFSIIKEINMETLKAEITLLNR